jgi:hypothetical protein
VEVVGKEVLHQKQGLSLLWRLLLLQELCLEQLSHRKGPKLLAAHPAST